MKWNRAMFTNIAVVIFVLILATVILVPVFAQTPAAAVPQAPSASPTPTPAPIPLSKRTWMNTSLSPEKRAELIVHAMTLDEKLTQIHMMDSREHPRMIQGIDRLGIPG